MHTLTELVDLARNRYPPTMTSSPLIFSPYTACIESHDSWRSSIEELQQPDIYARAGVLVCFKSFRQCTRHLTPGPDEHSLSERGSMLSAPIIWATDTYGAPVSMNVVFRSFPEGLPETSLSIVFSWSLPRLDGLRLLC